jgi:hypothetical protein
MFCKPEERVFGYGSRSTTHQIPCRAPLPAPSWPLPLAHQLHTCSHTAHHLHTRRGGARWPPRPSGDACVPRTSLSQHKSTENVPLTASHSTGTAPHTRTASHSTGTAPYTRTASHSTGTAPYTRTAFHCPPTFPTPSSTHPPTHSIIPLIHTGARRNPSGCDGLHQDKRIRKHAKHTNRQVSHA